MPSTRSVAAVIILVAMLAPAAAQETRSQTVHFPRGMSSTTIKDDIKGREAVRYSLGVTAGQRMSVQLDTNNASNYFNVTAPGASEALFIGSTSGNSTSFEIPSSGNYVIDVYLMRNAARRNETARYTLTVAVEGAAASPSKPSPPASAGGQA
ncbi:hypothetical protein AB4144_31540, partial [Rhizobiaceae sp. 2RAB30]